MLRPAVHRRGDEGAAEAGHDVPALMQRAGRAVAEEALRRFPDARCVRRRLRRRRERRRRADRARGAARCRAQGGRGGRGRRSDRRALRHRLPRRAPARRRRSRSRHERGRCPGRRGRPALGRERRHGRDRRRGRRADVTVTMHGRKVGLEVAPGRFHAGDVVVADIGLDHRETQHRLVTRMCSELVPRKRESDTKYTAGAVLVVGGSPGMTGAVTLTATAAFRADAGYVTVCSARVAPEHSARGGEATAGGGARRGRDARRARDRAGPRPVATRSRRSSGRCSKRPTCRRSSMLTGSSGSSRSSARRTRAHPARGRARPAARPRARRGWPLTGSRPPRRPPSASAASAC